jgi:hypothetical protein
MDLETWRKLFGKSQDDPAVKSALAAAGVKKVPKLGKDRTNARFDLKGHGLMILMTDEAYLKQLTDLDIGEGPLILSGVSAYLDKSVSGDLCKGELPYKLAATMSQEAVRKILGPPTSTREAFQIDVWLRDGIKIVARYSKDLKSMMTLGLMLPRAE